MSLTGQFVYIAHLFIFLWLNHFELSLEFRGRDGGLSTLCHKCGFACQQKMLKTLPDLGYLRFKDEEV